MVRSRTASEQDCEDILQDVYLKIYQNYESFQGQAQLSTWLYKICRSAISDYYRKPWWKFSFAAREEREAAPNNPEQLLSRKQEQTALQEIVAGLPKREQEIFRLRYFDNFSLDEIAEGQKIGLSTAKTHLYRAVAKVRNKLRERDDE